MTNPKLPFTLVAPPKEWVENGVQGICLGQCVAAALTGDFGKGHGVSWESQAHAHNTLFQDTEHNVPDLNFGWICVQSLESKKHGENVQRELGVIDLLPETQIPTLIQPGVLAFHEYAHILCPQDADIVREGRGHGPLWRAAITELGYPQEAQRYLLKIHTRKGPAATFGFRPGQTVRLREDVTPQYLRNQLATVIHVAKYYLTLEFQDVRTKNNIWAYWSVKRLV